MGADTASSATARWLQWQVKGPTQKHVEETLPSSFNLDGPIYYLRAGKSEVAACYAGTGGNYLLLGPKWNVILDFMDLSKLKTKAMGSTVCLFGGQDIVFRLFLPTVEEADQWAQKLSAASFERVSDQYLAHLQAKIQKQQKATRRARQAAAFGTFMEWLCSSSTRTAADMRLKTLVPSHCAPAAIRGEHHVYPARFYMKQCKTEAAGRISIHGDALILQWAAHGRVMRQAAVLTGATATVAMFMVSVRGENGLAMVRLWMNDTEEADEIAKAIEEAAKASSELIHRKTRPAASTTRRQMGAAASCICSTVLGAPKSVRNKIASSCASQVVVPSKKIENVASGALRMDGKCHILFQKAAEARFCHCTLRDDTLWFGEKASFNDQVLSLIGAKALAFDDMVTIFTPNGETHRLWPDTSAGTPEQWCLAIQAAGTHSAHLSKWEAMIKAEKFEAFAKAEVRRLARAQRFRNLGERLIYLPAKLTGLVHVDRRCATEVLMAWQQSSKSSLLAAKKEKSAIGASAGKSQQARFFRRADAGRALERSLMIKGDVIFVFNEDGNMEKPVPLAGATIYTNPNQKVCSVWYDGVMQARMFVQSEDAAESWGAQLEEASLLLSDATARLKAKNAEVKTASADAPKAAPSAEVITSMKVVAPPKMAPEEHHSSQKLQKTRSRRFVEETSPAKEGEATPVPEAAVGA
ncbi:unnamed protein product [Symbiodinium sp. CCMP2592]|nr:unnamed protein product [Symbiodinium sp. CCMP2592]